MSLGSPGNGSNNHMLAQLFKISTNTFMVHIPYAGTGPAIKDLLSGQIQVYFDQVASSVAHVKAGKLRSLAVSWHERLALLPDVPTFAESSLFANNNPSWFGLLAPAKTAPTDISRINKALLQALGETAIKDRFSQLGLFANGGTPAELSALIQKELETMSRVAKFAKISLEE